MKLSGISFRKCRGGIEAAREAPVRPEALPCPLCRLVFGGPPICSADRAPRRFFAAFAVFGKLHISCAGLCAFAPGKVRFLTSCLGSAENRSEARARSRQAAGFLGENLRFSRSPARQVLLLRNGRFARRAADGKKVRLFFAAVFGRRRACPLSTGRCGKSWKNKEISRSDDQAMEGSRCRNGLWRSWSSTGISAFF